MELFTDYINSLHEALSQVVITNTDTTSLKIEIAARNIVDLLKKTRGNGAVFYIIGNGGSAAIASHVQNDLCKGSGVKAMVFNETPLLTAYANDMSYQAAFEQMLRIWASPGDLLLAISSSGKSENILNAVKAAQELGCSVITLSGFAPENPLRKIGTINIYIPSNEYGIVETAHATILHYLTDMLKNEN